MSRAKHALPGRVDPLDPLDPLGPISVIPLPQVSPASPARRRWVSAATLGALLPGLPGLPVVASAAEAVESAEAAEAPAGAASAAAPHPPKLEDLFAAPTMSRASLSPDGKYLAAIGDARGLPIALIVDVKTQQARSITPNMADADRWRARLDGYAYDMRWLGPDLLILRMTAAVSMLMRPDGKVLRRLEGSFLEQLPDAPDGAQRVLLASEHTLYIVNLRTGERVKQAVDLPDEPDAWAFDAQGNLRAATTKASSRWSGQAVWTQWFRAAAPGSPWQALEKIEGDDVDRVWRPLRVLEDGQIAVLARGGRDTLAVFRYDPVKRQLGELMAGHDSDDIIGADGLDAAYFDAVATAGLKRQVFWFDPKWARLQKAVDAALPDSLNGLIGGARAEGHVLVHSRSDVDPGRWYALDTATLHMNEVGIARPEIDPAAMRPMTAYRYGARDGLRVPAYLTRPVGQGPAPTVVLIHGGPWARDDWAWDPEVQMLAANGYAVFQPQFRGSHGFGQAYLEAGYRQWGLAMQDDITDGVQDLIARGIADPARIAIVGASYGGYAAMWGLVKTPKLYRCGISFAGISDLADFLTTSWTDDSTAESRHVRRRLVGDPATAKAQLEAVSPIRHVDKIEVPLLLAHGTYDRRVLPDQSQGMARAMTQRGKAVEWLPLATGHGFPSQRSQMRRDYYARVLAFLGQHLAKRV